MPVSTTSDDTCPDACPLKASCGCYAAAGHLKFHWMAVSGGRRGKTFSEFLKELSTLPRGQVWRHNQAGDLPGKGNNIDGRMLNQLVETNRKASLHGFTYTHKPPTKKNLGLIRQANRNGFTINLSADTLAEADELVKKNVGPVVVLLPHDAPETLKTPEGNLVITCPAQTRDRVVCSNCKMCCDPDRTAVIGFRAHGPAFHKVEAVIHQQEKEESEQLT